MIYIDENEVEKSRNLNYSMMLFKAILLISQ